MSQPQRRPERRPTASDGFVIVDKPVGWTSHDVVAKMRWLAGTRKVGHAGTLDPMATGVLVVGVGRATKLLTYVVGADKSYTATIRLGVGTDTDDAEGEVTAAPGFLLLSDVSQPSVALDQNVPTATDGERCKQHGAIAERSETVSSCAQRSADAGSWEHVDTATPSASRETLQTAVASLTGEILQIPTTVSAIKVDGKRAYARARAGEEVELAARPVTVSQFAVTSIVAGRIDTPAGRACAVLNTVEAKGRDQEDMLSPESSISVLVVDLDVEVTVSSGTYVRALARDLGAALGTAGHLTALRRTSVGGHRLSEARTLEQLEAQADRDGVLATIPMADAIAATLSTRALSDVEATELGFGRWITPNAVPGLVAAVAPDGSLVALLENARRGGVDLARPKLVLAPA